MSGKAEQLAKEFERGNDNEIYEYFKNTGHSGVLFDFIQLVGQKDLLKTSNFIRLLYCDRDLQITAYTALLNLMIEDNLMSGEEIINVAYEVKWISDLNDAYKEKVEYINYKLHTSYEMKD